MSVENWFSTEMTSTQCRGRDIRGSQPREEFLIGLDAFSSQNFSDHARRLDPRQSLFQPLMQVG